MDCERREHPWARGLPFRELLHPRSVYPDIVNIYKPILTIIPAKHAVVGMTKQMALDYAKDRIHVNCLCPGFVQSPMIASLTQAPEAQEGLNAQHPWNAIGRPEDIADAALFLSSDEA